MWIAFIMTDPNGGTEYYGQISRSDFESLVGGSFESEFVKIENLSWLDAESDGKLYKFSKLGNSSLADFGYSNEGFFRTEHIVRIVPVRDEFIAQHSEAG